MFEDVHFLLTVQLRRRLERRGAFHCLPCKVDRHCGVGPAHVLNPLRRDEHLVTEPPVACVHNQVPNGPGLLIDEQPLYMPDVTIGRLNVIFYYRFTTAQVGIVILVARRFIS